MNFDVAMVADDLVEADRLGFGPAGAAACAGAACSLRLTANASVEPSRRCWQGGGPLLATAAAGTQG